MALVLGLMVVMTVLMGIIAIIYYIHQDSLPPIERAKFILENAPLIDGYNIKFPKESVPDIYK